MTIYLNLLVALIGVLMYALSANPKVNELGRLLFFCGVLTFLLCWCNGAHPVTLLQ